MSKKSLVKNKYFLPIVITIVFLVALGIIFLIIFINKENNLTKEEKTRKKIYEILDTKAEEETIINKGRVMEILTTDQDKKTQIDKEEILNLLNQKNN